MKAWELQRLEKSKRDLAVFIRNGFRCVYCEHDGTTFEGWCHLVVDHVVPKHLARQQGKDLEYQDNLVTACWACNNLKGQYKAETLEQAKAEVSRLSAQMRDQVWAVEFAPHIPNGRTRRAWRQSRYRNPMRR
jgi:5-methylcytosine-specific restriction endonuclease McrA